MRFALGIVFLVLIGIGAYQFVLRDSPEARANDPLRYENPSYGYSFDIPPGHQIESAVPEYVAITDTTGEEGRAEVQILRSDLSDTHETFAGFAYAIAARGCEADGPTGSARCAGVTRTAPFDTSSGERGEVFYLEYIVTEFPSGATTTREAGPFYVFDIGSREGVAGYTALMIRSTFGAEESERYDEGVTIAHSVADTIRLSR